MAPPRIKVRGAGRSKGIPSGYILGRISSGTGDVELLDKSGQRAAGIASSGQVASVAGTHGFGFFSGGLLADGELLGSATFPSDITFASGGGSVTSEFPAAALAVLNLKAPDPSSGLDIVVGTFTFAAGSKTAVIVWGTGTYTLVAGKVLKLLAPHPADFSLANLHGTVTGSE